MNLDKYKHITLSVIKNTQEEGIIYLATDDHKAAAKTAEAYNTISTLQNKKDFFYVANIVAYLKED